VQSYGLGAPRGEALAPVDYLYSSSTNKLNGAPRSQYEDEEGTGDAGEGYGMHASVSVTSSLEQQVRLLKKELKAKDDKLTRLTEHALMMGAHMDKLKGEVRSCFALIAVVVDNLIVAAVVADHNLVVAVDDDLVVIVCYAVRLFEIYLFCFNDLCSCGLLFVTTVCVFNGAAARCQRGTRGMHARCYIDLSADALSFVFCLFS
jgi:hypothetical protein